MLAFAPAVVQALVATTEAVLDKGPVARIIAALFDPAWNVENGATIWAIIVLTLFLSGVGLPLPEDIPLTLAGFTTFKQAGDRVVLWQYFVAFWTVTAPILLGDVLAYGLGRRYGFGLRERVRPLKRLLSDRRMARVQGWFDDYGSFTIFLGRQVAGVRFVTFFTAGTMRVPLHKFVFFDFLGCLVSVPVWLGLGVLASRYGEEWLQTAMKKVGSGFLLGVVGAIVIAVFVVRLRNNSRQKAAVVPTKETE